MIQGFTVQISKEIAPKCGENWPISGRRKKTKNPVTSLAVMFFFSVPISGPKGR